MSDRIKDYKLIQRYQVEDLEKDVKEHIRAGYELLGAPHLTTDQEDPLHSAHDSSRKLLVQGSGLMLADLLSMICLWS